jgi:hypothetical protein
MSTYRIIHSVSGREEILTSSDMEWIHNSLRLMQEKQQEKAAEHSGHIITASDIGEGSETPDATIDIGEDLFQGQFHDVTGLRERLVTLVGYDMTDG